MSQEYKLQQPNVLPVTDKLYRLAADYEYLWAKINQENEAIHNRLLIPAGFTYDGATVPRLFWTLTGIRPDGLIRAAALVHDYIYEFSGRLPAGVHQYRTGDGAWQNVTGRWSRYYTDRLFKKMMHEAGVSSFKCRLAYITVRIVGRFTWRR